MGLQKNISSFGLRPGRLDDATHAQMTIAYEHHEVHEGAAFFAGSHSLNIGAAPVHISFTTPAASGPRIHMALDAYAAGAATLLITEAPTGGLTGGTALTAFNRRRDSTRTSAITNLKYGATDPLGGTIFPTFDLGSGTGPKFVSGGRDVSEMVLKPGVQYSYQLTGGAVAGNMLLRWYEHTDRN